MTGTQTLKTETAAPGRAPALAAVALLCFFVSGASGLVYEVVWVRSLGLFFGASAFAISTVLASFMAGLALGSYVFGRVIDRRGHPLKYYASLELGIAVSAAVLPLVFHLLNLIYRPVYADGAASPLLLNGLRFVCAFLALLVPTTFMGGTLPILARYVVGSWGRLGERIGLLYAVNTLGAVLGTFGTGFLLLPHLGLRGATLVAVAGNLLVAALAWRAAGALAWRRERARGSAAPDAAPGAASGSPGGNPWPVLVAFGVSGFVALTLEVAWTRFLVSVLGTTVYAFTTMLTTLLLGLALGSWIVSRVLDRVRGLVFFLGVIEAAIGLTVLASLWFFGDFPNLFLALFWKWGSGWSHIVAIEFLLAMAVMLVPCLFLGSTFAVVAKIYARDQARLGGRVGTAYAFNTVGAILGSLAGGFLFLPALGVEKTCVLAGLLAVGTGLVLAGPIAGRPSTRTRIVVVVLAGGAAILGAALRPPWDPRLLSRGIYLYASEYPDRRELRRSMAEVELRYQKEEADGTVSVESGSGYLSLRVNGKVDASTATDMGTQILLAHIPLILHHAPGSALLIGLGSGVTLGSIEQYPVSKIDCVEISPGVIQAAHYFSAANHDCLADPRLNMIHGDGRNHLLLTDRRYDVIISEPSNPWISGVGYLFTREAFQLARDHLAPGGIVCQWFHGYQMSERDFRAILNTYHQVFPHVQVWMSNLSDVLMLGSVQPIPLSFAEVGERMKSPPIRDDLARLDLHSPAALMSLYVMDESGLESYVGSGAALHTDDNMLLEFSASRNLFLDTTASHLEGLLRERRPVAGELADAATLTDSLRQDLNARFEARGDAFECARSHAQDEVAALRKIDEAYRLAPDDPLVATLYAEQHIAAGHAILGTGRPRDAVVQFDLAAMPRLSGLAFAAFQDLGVALLQAGNPDRALVAWGEAEAMEPSSPDLLYNQGQALSALGREPEADAKYRAAIRLDPAKQEALNNLAWSLATHGGDLAEAERLAERAVELEPSAGNYDTMGWVYFLRKDHTRAIRALSRSIELDPNQAETYLHLGKACREEGDREKARTAFQQAISKDQPDGATRKEAEHELQGL